MCCRQTLTPDFSFKLQNDRLTLSEPGDHFCDFNSELAQNCFFLLKTGLLSHVCLSYYKGNVIEEKIKGWIQEETKREQKRICLHGIERF